MAKNSSVKRGERIQVRIDRLAVGGRGVARHQGMVLFVSDAAPGDLAEVEVTFLKKNFAEAELTRVIEAAPSRMTPPCPVAGICGGCNWQHIVYEEQLRSKRQLVLESLRKFSGFHLDDDFVHPVVPSPKEFRYRNRIQLHYSGSRIGFYRRGSHEIVDIDDCPITDERLSAMIPELRRELAHRKASRLEIYLTQDGKTARRVSVRDAVNDTEETEGPGAAGPAFSQVNTEQNENLVEYVRDLVGKLPEPKNIYDLYAGSGNFTFPIQRTWPTTSITGVELSRASVQSANERIEHEHLPQHFRFVCESVDTFIKGRRFGEESLVLLDPPRTGCGPGVMTELASQKPRTIVYVSCHPATLSRDLKPLSETGYRLVSVRPFDMFPQTDHVETVVHLERST